MTGWWWLGDGDCFTHIVMAKLPVRPHNFLGILTEYIYIYILIYIYICIYIYIHTYIYIFTHTYAYVTMYNYTYMVLCLVVLGNPPYVRVVTPHPHTYVYICTYAYYYIPYTHMCIYIYIIYCIWLTYTYRDHHHLRRGGGSARHWAIYIYII